MEPDPKPFSAQFRECKKAGLTLPGEIRKSISIISGKPITSQSINCGRFGGECSSAHPECRKLRGAEAIPEALKLADIPAIVDEGLDDRGAFRAQLAENLCRKDLSAFEEGAAFQTAIEKFGLTREEVAEQFGVKRSTVYSRLRLLGLAPEVRGVLAEKQIPDSIATLIATIPDGKMQVKAAKEIGPDARYDERAAMSFRTAQEHIEQNYRRSLKGAPFNLNDAELLAAAGSCAACPKRSGNLEPDSTQPNFCTDPPCYERKLRAHGELVAAELMAKRGLGLVPADEMNAEWSHDGDALVWNSLFIEADQKVQEAKERTVGELMKGGAVKPVVAITPNGEARVLFRKKDVHGRMVELGILKAEKTSTKDGKDGRDGRNPVKDLEKARAAAAEREREQKINVAVGRAFTAAIVERFAGGKLPDKQEAAAWRLVLGWLAENDWINHDVITARRGWKSIAVHSEAAKHKLSGVECRALVLEAFFVADAYAGVEAAYEWDRLEEMTKALGLDRKGIEKGARKAFEKTNPLTPALSPEGGEGVKARGKAKAKTKGNRARKGARK